MLLSALVFGLFGAVIGSFLNVLALRHGVKTLGGRSACASCGHELEAVDLIPIISWLALRGRCRFCGSKISLQYPLVEAATAILFGCIGAWAAAHVLAISWQEIAVVADYLAVMALLVAISTYDLKHGIIPDAWVYTLCALALIQQFIAVQPGGLPLFTYLIAGPAIALPFAVLWLVSKGTWMGLGDAKLALGIGWLLGPVYGLLAVALAFILGAVISVCILLPLSSRKVRKVIQGFTPTPISERLVWGFTMKSEVAFGPFLAIGCVIIWLTLLFGHDPLAYLSAVSLP